MKIIAEFLLSEINPDKVDDSIVLRRIERKVAQFGFVAIGLKLFEAESHTRKGYSCELLKLNDVWLDDSFQNFLFHLHFCDKEITTRLSKFFGKQSYQGFNSLREFLLNLDENTPGYSPEIEEDMFKLLITGYNISESRLERFRVTKWKETV